MVLNKNKPAWVQELDQALQEDRDQQGMAYDAAWQARCWLQAGAASPVFVGLCTLLPPLGVSAVLGGTAVTILAGNVGSAVIGYYGYLEGVRRWDIAHGYEAYPTQALFVP